jgi:hypothetical protein
MNRTRILGAVATAALLATPSLAIGQTLAAPAQRPGQGLFDRTHRGTQSLDVSVSLAGAYDDDVLAEGGGSGGSGPLGQQSGLYSAATTNLAYSKTFRLGEFALSEGSAVRYYPSLTDLVSVQHAATVGLGFHFGRTSLNVSQTLAYLPFFAFANTPKLFDSTAAELPPVVGDQAMVRRNQRVFGSSIGVTQRLGARTSLSANANVHRVDFLDESIGQVTKELGVRLTRSLTRDFSLVLGYSYQDGVYGATVIDTVPVRLHNLDAGVDYNHALGRTRRTTIGFTTGSSVIDGGDRGSQRQITGSARLNREIGRTWHASALYRRGVGFVDGFAQPMFADSVATSLGGTISRRLDLVLAANYLKGEMGFGPVNSDNQNYSGSARARIAIARQLMIFAEYYYFRYHFADAAVLPVGVPADVNRQGVRIGFELWLPVIR